MTTEISKDQHFLIDQSIINTLISSANITTDDIILEIGAGSGNITLPLSKQTAHLFASEIDTQFFPALQKIPNITLLPGDILKTLPKQQHITTVIGNIPYQLTEPLMHLLCQSRSIHKATFILPKTFAQRLHTHPVFSAFWHTNIIQDVPSSAFQPKPRGTSVIAHFTRHTDTNPQSYSPPSGFSGIGKSPRWTILSAGKFGTLVTEQASNCRLDEQVGRPYIIRKLYLQPTKKLKNGLRDTVIDYYKTKNKTLTKKRADAMIEKLSLSSVNKTISSLKPQEYKKISEDLTYFLNF